MTHGISHGQNHNRRAKNEARALAWHTEAMIARARACLVEGDGLEAMRLVRAAKGLNQIDKRVRLDRAFQGRQRQIVEEAEREIAKRERACKHRESLIEISERDIRSRQAELQETEAALSATYQLMRKGECVGPARATGELTDSGVAPI